MYHVPSPYLLPSHLSTYRLHHTMHMLMRDKPSLWMTSNDHFQNKFHLFINQKFFGYLNDHFIFKTMHLFVGSEFLVSHHRLRKPKHFYSLSSTGTMSDHNWRVFHPRGGSITASLFPTHIFFTTLFNRATLLDVVPFNRAHPIKHQTQCRFINHALTPI